MKPPPAFQTRHDEATRAGHFTPYAVKIPLPIIPPPRPGLGTNRKRHTVRRRVLAWSGLVLACLVAWSGLAAALCYFFA